MNVYKEKTKIKLKNNIFCIQNMFSYVKFVVKQKHFNVVQISFRNAFVVAVHIYLYIETSSFPYGCKKDRFQAHKNNSIISVNRQFH